MNQNQSVPLTDEEAEQLASLLKRATWPLPLPVFFALLALTPTPALELVVISEVPVQGKFVPRVLLFPRPASDPFFAGLMHACGVQIMKGETLELALKRLEKKELGGPGKISAPVFVDWIDVQMGPLPDRNPRGQEVGLIHYALWKGGELPKDAVLADPNNLPANMIGFHRDIIAKAMQKWKNDTFLARSR